MEVIELDVLENDLNFEFENDKDLDKNKNVNEVGLYLMESLEKKNNTTFDILNWWKVNSTKYHPIIGQIVRDHY